MRGAVSSSDEFKKENPYAHANWISRMTFWYSWKFFRMGEKHHFEEKDLSKPLSEYMSCNLGNKFAILWSKEVDRAALSGGLPSLYKVIFKCFYVEYILHSILLIITELGLRMVQPLCLGLLMRYFSQDENDDQSLQEPKYIWRILHYWSPDQSPILKSEAYFYAFAIFFCSAIVALVSHPYMMDVMFIGMKIRIACCSLIYRKVLRISLNCADGSTVGMVVNLISNDVNRFDIAPLFLQYLWISPLQIVIIMFFMFKQLQLAGFYGVMVVVGVIPIQALFGQCTIYLRKRTGSLTDERVRFMNEIIQGMQVIKMYAWEYAFANVIKKSRHDEVKVLRHSAFIKGVVMSFIMFTSRSAVFVTVVSYVLITGSINAEAVFVMIAFYQILRQTVTVYFAQGVTNIAEAIVAVSRIRHFLLTEETDVGDPTPIDPTWKLKTNRRKYRIERDNELAKFSLPKSVIITHAWAKFDEVVCLQDINLTILPGQLTCCIGEVGSGKSCLLQLILGELLPFKGDVQTHGVISYASQAPWLFAGSVRQNILFGQKYDHNRYRKVIKVCSLTRDFTLLPYGDRTIVGEKGISLSGGQRARVSLARAVYKVADIYLLDDPLSAVDPHVGQQLFDDCISGYLKSKAVILVTHQLQYLQSVKQIVILDQGKILIKGSYAQLQKSGLDFAKLLETPDNEETIESDDDLAKAQNVINVISTLSMNSLTIVTETTSNLPVEVAEMRTEGRVGSKVYKEYFHAGANSCTLFVVLLFFFGAQFFCSGSDYFLLQWISVEEGLADDSHLLNNLTRQQCIIVYGFFILATIVVAISRALLFFIVCMNSSKNLHDNMFNSVIRASMRFFNTNPSGRILNRFSKDLGAVDEFLPNAMIDTLQIVLNLLGLVIVLVMVSIYLFIPTVFVCIAFHLIRKRYIHSSRNIKRLEGITKSPVFSHLNATLQGLPTIRSHGKEMTLVAEFDRYQDTHSNTWFMYLVTSRAFGYALDVICVLYVGLITLSFFILPTPFTGPQVGLAVTQLLGLTGMFQWGMRQSAELENQMTSVERVLEFTHIEHEPPLESEESKKPPPNWPTEGKIECINTSMRYCRSEPPVLKNLNLVLLPKEKVGIVGRTGAGKSSLISALFRLAYLEGQVIIDTIDVGTLGLHDLRKKISIIPQEPVLFSGTLRYNLDPFKEYDDYAMLKALEAVENKAALTEGLGCLDMAMSEGGTNISVGERQLICLARAIIRNNKILVMDEATANVDPHTDFLIQNTIRTTFAACTVLTIAHRLNTVMDSDKIIVMDAGNMVEFEHPYILLQDKDSIFTSLVERTGLVMAETLRNVAEESYARKHRSHKKSKKKN